MIMEEIELQYHKKSLASLIYRLSVDSTVPVCDLMKDIRELIRVIESGEGDITFTSGECTSCS